MATWSDLEVKALLAIWSDSKIQEELDGAVRNKQLYEKNWKNKDTPGIGNSAVLKLKTLKQEDNNKTGNGRAILQKVGLHSWA